MAGGLIVLIGSLPQNVSRVHREFITINEKLFPGHRLYLEYPVKKLVLNNNIKDPVLLASVRYLNYDIYNETMNILIEIQGSHHYKFNPFFHKEYGNFDIQQLNDKLKKRVSNIAGISLIEIKSDQKLTEEFIKGIYG